MEPIITFIIPSVARETIHRSINSLLNQTNPNWFCIVVYDGVDGPDFEDERIKCVKIIKTGVFKHNGQSGLVRNEGLKLCNTEWIGFLDDDDTLHPNYVQFLQEKYLNYDFVVWRMKYDDGFILPELDRTNLEFGRVGISFCYKNKFENLFFEMNKDGEDFDFLKKLENLSNNWLITPEIFYNVRH